jgi:Cu/Zn superoxide dismutase
MSSMIVIAVLLCLMVGNYITEAKTVTAFFTHGVMGTVSFSQDNKSTFTTVNVSLVGVSNGPNKYHIHRYPILTADGCGQAAGHYNPDRYPFHRTKTFTKTYISIANPGLCNSSMTEAQKVTACEVGDLSGKFGLLTSSNAMATYSDGNLPLFGAKSIVGRSIVIHASDGSRLACASIGYPGTPKVVTAVFTGPTIFGSIRLTQEASKSSADTSVFVHLNQVLIRTFARSNAHHPCFPH